MRYQNRSRPIQHPPPTHLLPQPRNICPKRHGRSFETLNLPIQLVLWVLEDPIDVHVFVLRDYVCYLGFDAGQVGCHADFAEGFSGRSDDVVFLATGESPDIERGGAEEGGVRPGGGG